MLPGFFLKEQCRLRLAHPWIQNAWTQIHWSVHSGVTPGLIRAISYILASLLPLLGLLPPCSWCVGGPCSPLGLGAQRSWRECVGWSGGEWSWGAYRSEDLECGQGGHPVWKSGERTPGTRSPLTCSAMEDTFAPGEERCPSLGSTAGGPLAVLLLLSSPRNLSRHYRCGL